MSAIMSSTFGIFIYASESYIYRPHTLRDRLGRAGEPFSASTLKANRPVSPTPSFRRARTADKLGFSMNSLLVNYFLTGTRGRDAVPFRGPWWSVFRIQNQSSG